MFELVKLPICKDFKHCFYDENRGKKEINIVENIVIIICSSFIAHSHGDYVQNNACGNKVFKIIAFT